MNFVKFTLLCITGWMCITFGGAEVKEADGSNATAVGEVKPTFHSIPFLPDDLSWKNGFGQALAIGGIFVSSLVILGGLAWLLAPLFGYRICTVLGNCDLTSTTQDPVQPNYNDYSQFPQFSGYRKRSLKYIGPILKTLASAYEKYEQKES